MNSVFRSIKNSSFVNSIIFPKGGSPYETDNLNEMGSYKLLWLRNSSGDSFPNLWIPRLGYNPSSGVILYCHGNGGTVKNWYEMLKYYSHKFDCSILAVEYPGYGPASGRANEETVNDNVYSALEFLLSIGYPYGNIILMGYSIGTGPTIQIAAECCSKGNILGCLITIAAFSSIRDLVNDFKGSKIINTIAPLILAERWNSLSFSSAITCPCIFIHGKRDTLIPYTHSERIYENCISTEKLLHICHNADHIRFREPLDTVDPIACFLRAHFHPLQNIHIELNEEGFPCPDDVSREYIEKEKKRLNELEQQNSSSSTVSSDISAWVSSSSSILTNFIVNTVTSSGNGVQRGLEEPN